MRLHRLELGAFGPFAGRQSVDFDELSAAGLFLLHGPTGAGKTSVLDGVCFALYGQVPGARPATRLRSDHAAPGTRTEAVLELTLGGRRLEITRRPEQLRAKKRGSGTTTDKAVTLLRERVDGEWRGLSKSHQEIGEEIRQLVGMSCEQFCQVVLLPQGEFATFLRAGAIERAALLGRLFDTRRFKAVEHWLRDRKAEAGQRLAQGDEELRRLAARMRQAAGPAAAVGADTNTGTGTGTGTGTRADADGGARSGAGSGVSDSPAAPRPASGSHSSSGPPPAPGTRPTSGSHPAAGPASGSGSGGGFGDDPDLGLGENGLGDALLAWAAILRCDARERHEIARVSVARAESEHAAAADALAEARDLHALQRRRADALARADRLAAHRAARTATRTALALAHRAAAVDPAFALRDKAATQHAESAATARTVLAELTAAAPAADAAAAVPPGREPLAASLTGAEPAERTASGAAAEGDVPPARRPDAGPGRRPGTDDARHGPGVPRARGGSGAAVRPHERDDGDEGDDAPGAGRRAAASPEPGSGPDAGAGAHAGTPGRGRNGPDGPAAEAPGSSALRRGVALKPLAEPAEPAEPFGPAGSARPDAPAPRDDPAELTRLAGRLREELGGLGNAREAERRVAEIHERREVLEREERDDDEAVRDAQAWLDEWPRARAALQARLDAGMDGAARAAQSAAELDTARRRLDAAAERDRLRAESARAEDAVRDARDRAAGAREHWQDLREARIAGIAAELADGLAAGEPCRVCGATEHPAPARPAGHRVGRAEEDAAYDDFQRASAGHERAGAHLARLRAALDAATAVAGQVPLAELAAAHAALRGEHERAAAAAGAVAEARAALDRAEIERDARTAQRHDALSRTAARTSRREELDDQHRRLTAELTRARAGHASVEARRRALAARIALLDRAAHAVRDRIESAARLAEAEAALLDAVTRAGFGSPREAAAALLPQARLWEAERQVEAWAREEAAVEADLAAPGPEAAAALAPADPEAAQTSLDAANRRLRDASSAESAAATRCRELDLLSAQAAARTRELGPARDDFARVRRLADLASASSAQNRYRMELETYVLAARLEQVAAAAGVRLQRMSAGRYTLVHTDARGGGRAKSGLGLMVVDAWTGTERDTATLSGGETFFASLALALGLADVVTDESGGTRLDTLFIDEGFGSLDDQTLDEVLDVLDGLRERDRAVGIVSHVADLRHRIPAQLRVVKGRDGSTLRMRPAAARG